MPFIVLNGIWPLEVVNKVLLKLSYVYSFIFFIVAFILQWQTWSSCSRDFAQPAKPKIFIIYTFGKNLLTPGVEHLKWCGRTLESDLVSVLVPSVNNSVILEKLLWNSVYSPVKLGEWDFLANVNSFIQQIFMECFLYARHCHRLEI